MTLESEHFIKVGYVSRAHSIKGELYVRLFAGRADWSNHLTAITLAKETVEPSPTPQSMRILPVQTARPHKDGLIISTPEIVDRTQAETFVGYQVFIPEKWLVAKPGETPFLHELLGFEIVDTKLGSIGRVDSFASNGPQDLFVVQERLIPFVQAFVEDLDFAGKKIRMNLPDGLLNL